MADQEPAPREYLSPFAPPGRHSSPGHAVWEFYRQQYVRTGSQHHLNRMLEAVTRDCPPLAARPRTAPARAREFRLGAFMLGFAVTAWLLLLAGVAITWLVTGR